MAPTNSTLIKELKYWIISILLFCPVLILYGINFISGFNSPDHIPTGFIQYDMPYYMANAREYADNHTLNLFYPSAYTHLYDSASIYFHIHIYLLGIIFYFTQCDPGLLFCLFGFIAGVCCIRMFIQLYNHLFGLNTFYQKVGLVIFCWGGGILSIVGIVYNLLSNYTISQAIRKALIFDPFNGWWFLNLGRNLFFPTEAYYHLLFIGAVYCILRKKYTLCLILTLLLSLSHPFTGIELILIILFWSIFEVVFIQNKNLPIRLIIYSVLILVFHIGYYLFYLNSFAEHKVLMKQWSLPWTYEAVNFVPAYFLVAMIAFGSVNNVANFKKIFKIEFYRLCFIWFIVAFALANHEFAFKPIQPLHFTRGYIWTPLCLLGMSFLLSVFEKVWHTQRRLISFFIIGAITLVFLFDNILWISIQSYRLQSDNTTYLSKDMQGVFQVMNNHTYEGYYVVSQDFKLGYWVTVYTPLRSWLSHIFNTPDVENKTAILRKFYHEGIIHSEWKHAKVLFVFDKMSLDKLPAILSSEFMVVNKKVYENASYIIYTNQ